MTGFLIPLVFLGALLMLAPDHVLSQEMRGAATFKEEPLSIHSGTRIHKFDVEVALTSRQQNQGLMFRRFLDAKRGMLLVYRRPIRASMWMKNTFIPLDMFFIRADGTISRIVERTMPHSQRIIRAPGLVKGVLELNAGTAARLGIRTGDRVVSRSLDAP